MQYRKLGRWGVKVSEVALGSWLTYGGKVDENEAIKQIHFAHNLGINFIDTANVYASGKAEEFVGKAISSMRRDDIFLATKVYFPMGSGPNDKGLSRKHVWEQCHASLKRMNVEYIDLFQCHRYDPDTPIEELVTTMGMLTRQGKILYWGVSEWPADRIREAVETARAMQAPPPVSNQPCYNMLTRDIEREVIPACESYGLGQVVFSPLAQGILTGKYKPNQAPPSDSRAAQEKEGVFIRGRGGLDASVLETVQRLSKLAQDSGLTMPQMALAWCLRIQSISSVIIGASKVEQIEQNVKAAGTLLPPDLLKKIEEILRAAPVRK